MLEKNNSKCVRINHIWRRPILHIFSRAQSFLSAGLSPAIALTDVKPCHVGAHWNIAINSHNMLLFHSKSPEITSLCPFKSCTDYNWKLKRDQPSYSQKTKRKLLVSKLALKLYVTSFHSQATGFLGHRILMRWSVARHTYHLKTWELKLL